MSPRKPAPDRDGEDALAVLNPDREVVIGGETIVVREYGFFQALKLAPLTQPIIASMVEAFKESDQVSLDAIRLAFAAHPEQVVALIAESCSRTPEWVRGLNDADGEALLLTWQAVMTGFFVRRVVTEFAWKQRMAEGLIGAMSSPPSSPTATMPNGSAATRSVN